MVDENGKAATTTKDDFQLIHLFSICLSVKTFRRVRTYHMWIIIKITKYVQLPVCSSLCKQTHKLYHKNDKIHDLMKRISDFGGSHGGASSIYMFTVQ